MYSNLTPQEVVVACEGFGRVDEGLGWVAGAGGLECALCGGDCSALNALKAQSKKCITQPTWHLLWDSCCDTLVVKTATCRRTVDVHAIICVHVWSQLHSTMLLDRKYSSQHTHKSE